MTKRIVLLQALASTLKDLGYILKGVDAEGLDAEGLDAEGLVAEGFDTSSESTADSWSVKDVLAHLAYVEGCYQERLARVLEEDNPTVAEIMPDDTPLDAGSTTAEQLTRFKVARTRTVMTLKGISPGQWQRPAVHERTGKTTLRFLVQLLIEHDIEHLNQIVQLQQAARTVPVRDAQPAVKKLE